MRKMQHYYTERFLRVSYWWRVCIYLRIGEDLVSEPPLQTQEIETRKRCFRSITTPRRCTGPGAWRSAMSGSRLPHHQRPASLSVFVYGLCSVAGRRCLPATAWYFRSRGSRRGTSCSDVIAPPAAVSGRRRRVRSSSGTAFSDVPRTGTRRI